MNFIWTKINPLFIGTEKTLFFIIMSIFYKVLQVFSGLDYGFFNFKSPKATYLVKLLSLTISTTLCGISITYYDNIFDTNWITFWFCIFLFKYMITVLHLISLNYKESLYAFHYELHLIDSKLGVDPASFNIEIKIMCISFMYMILKVVNCILFCSHHECVRPIFVTIICTGASICIDMLLILYSFIFCSVSCRLKKLFSILEKTKSDFTSLQFIYKLYIDHIEKYKKAYDPLIITTLLFKIPEIIVVIYLTVEEIRFRNLSISFALNSDKATVMEALMAIFTPAICASKLAPQADRIKILLFDKVMQERDETKIREINRFINYVEARPCRFRVCKVIPLDIDLLVMVLSFCVTHLIVIIQFTNVF